MLLGLRRHLQECAEGGLDEFAPHVAGDEHQARAAILAGPGGQRHRRMEDVLYAVDDDRRILPLDVEDAPMLRMPLTRRMLLPTKAINTSSQVASVSSGIGSSTVKQKARIWSSWRFTSPCSRCPCV